MFASAYMGRKSWGEAPSNALIVGTLCVLVSKSLVDRVKAFEKNRFRPMYAGANMGHPSSF